MPGGAPKFRALSASSEDGSTISDMQIAADFFPYDEFEQPLTHQSIEARLRLEGYDLECLDWPVDTALERGRKPRAGE